MTLNKYLKEIQTQQHEFIIKDAKDLTNDERDQLLALTRKIDEYHEKISKFKFDDTKLSSSLFIKLLIKGISNNKIFRIVFASTNNKLVGFISYKINKENKAIIQNFYVMDEYRKQNVGRELMKICMENIWKENPESVQLSVMGGNESAVEFYKHFGFDVFAYTLYHKKSRKIDE